DVLPESGAAAPVCEDVSRDGEDPSLGCSPLGIEPARGANHLEEGLRGQVFGDVRKRDVEAEVVVNSGTVGLKPLAAKGFRSGLEAWVGGTQGLLHRRRLPHII